MAEICHIIIEVAWLHFRGAGGLDNLRNALAASNWQPQVLDLEMGKRKTCCKLHLESRIWVKVFFSGFFIHFSRRIVLFLWQQRTLKLLVKKFYSNYYSSVMMQTFCPNYKCAQTEFFLFFSQNRFLLFFFYFFAFSIIFCLK